MPNFRLPMLASAVWLCASFVAAELPAPDQVESDLAGRFAVKTAQPELKPRGPLAKRIEALMMKQAGYLIGTLKPWKETSGALLLTDGNSGEHGIRPNSHTAYALAVMSRTVPDGYPEGLSPEICRDRAIGILKFVLPTHGAGGVKCSNGKHWNSQWQFAYWAGQAAEAAWLLWDDLDPELRWLAARMAADEADRFVGQTPPAQVKRDTKAEENAWNSTVISLAANMLPKHPNAEDWRKAAKIWAVSSFVREADLKRNREVDGFKLQDVLAGPTIHDDYTLENHHRVHPDYMNCINLCRFQRLGFNYAGLPTPESNFFNTREVWSVLKTLAFPDGGYIYANGQDWDIHRLPHWIDTHAGEAVWNKDRRAALIFRNILETAEKMSARDPNGGMFLPDEYFFPSNQHMSLDILADTYLLLRTYDEGPEPTPAEEFWKELSGRHVFETGKFALMRTPKSVSTFSWGQQIMGMPLPLSKDLLLNPNERSLIGIISADGVKHENPRVRKAEVAPIEDGFGVAGVLERAGGRIEQRFAYLALPDGRTIYIDDLRTTDTSSLRQLDLGTLGILNEPRWVYHDGSRTIYHDQGQEVFEGGGGDQPEAKVLNASWVNVDDMLGAICLGPNRRQVYHPNQKPARGRVEQLFHLNSVDIDDLKNAGSGETAARTIIVFHPSQSHEKTAAAAGKTRLEESGSEAGKVILEDGTGVAYDLAAGVIGYEKP